MPASLKELLLAVAVLCLSVGCKPEIGDDCQLSTDCSAQADRLCDITAPGGYCTIFNCEPGSCPEDESLCVQFGSQRSPIDSCRDDQTTSPYARTFCMATCDDDADCRDDYVCQNLSDSSNRWGATLIDRDRGNRACVVSDIPPAVEESDLPNFGEVCHAEVPNPEPEPEPEPADGGAGGQSNEGAGGQGPSPSADAGAGGNGG